MKKHSKVGGKPGKPGYRTPSSFIIRKGSYLDRPSQIKNFKFKFPKKSKKMV